MRGLGCVLPISGAPNLECDAHMSSGGKGAHHPKQQGDGHQHTKTRFHGLYSEAKVRSCASKGIAVVEWTPLLPSRHWSVEMRKSGRACPKRSTEWSGSPAR